MKVKVCGITQIEQAVALNQLHIDFVGFIFYKKSPRYILNHLTENDIKNIKGNYKKTGVFVNASTEEILKTATACELDYIQLHGDESPDICKRISSEKPVIKSFGVKDATNLNEKIKAYSDNVDYFIFDTSSKNHGGTGRKFDWNILQKLHINKPYFLSGGIDDKDIADIHSLTNSDAGKYLFSLDINSKFEITPGVKDVEKIRRFMQQLKVANV